MLNKRMQLVSGVSQDKVAKETMRSGYGRGLVGAAQRDDRVVVVCADLTESTKTNHFRDKFPDRFVQVGVAEQNLVTVASGLAAVGKIPFAVSYSVFSPGRNWEQIRTTICLNDQNVKIIGSHAGITVGPDGATHQMLEDIALMRPLPNMMVVAPADSIEAEKAVLEAAVCEGPVYIRLSRHPSPIFTTYQTPFSMQKAMILHYGENITLISSGWMTYQSLKAALILAKKGISAEVLHIPVIKPLDNVTILDSIRRTNLAITIEDGQIAGGLGGAVAELSTEHHPVKIKRIGINDSFGESGSADELINKYNLKVDNIVETALQLVDDINNKKG